MNRAESESVPKLSEDELWDIHSAALGAGLAEPERRPLLLAGLDPRVFGQLRYFGRPSDQLIADLRGLNDLGLLETWLDNAERLAMPPHPRLRRPPGRQVRSSEVMADSEPREESRMQLSADQLTVPLTEVLQAVDAGLEEAQQLHRRPIRASDEVLQSHVALKKANEAIRKRLVGVFILPSVVDSFVPGLPRVQDVSSSDFNGLVARYRKLAEGHLNALKSMRAALELCGSAEQKSDGAPQSAAQAGAGATQRVVTAEPGRDSGSHRSPRPGEPTRLPIPAGVSMSAEPSYLFSWIHLSDLHFGHGAPTHQSDQKIVLDALAADIKEQGAGHYPVPHALLITGDIAFSGASRSPDEYSQAEAWLTRLLDTHGLTRSAVFMVPGNHDVSRAVERNDRNVRRLLEVLHRDGKQIDNEALAHEDDRMMLARRQQAYLDFVQRFDPMRAELWWRHSISVGDITVHLVGLNTALVAAEGDDLGRLEVGRRQLYEVLGSRPNPRDVVMVLSHHPAVEGWLRDQEEVASHVRTHSHIHLSGHIHKSSSRSTLAGGGSAPHISIHAGAAHGEANEPRSFGFNAGALFQDERGLVLRLWSLKWSEENRDFRIDSEKAAKGRLYMDYVLLEHAKPRP